MGKVIESKQGKKAKAGNDVYLSIDANLQKAAYDLLEEKLAGIILSNLTTSLTYDRTQAEEGSAVSYTHLFWRCRIFADVRGTEDKAGWSCDGTVF